MNLPVVDDAAPPESSTDIDVLPQCPECGEQLVMAAEPVVTELLECGGCGAELEVLAVGPVLLALAPEIEEDWGE